MKLKKKKKIKRRKISMKICISEPSVPGPHLCYKERALTDAPCPSCPRPQGRKGGKRSDSDWSVCLCVP